MKNFKRVNNYVGWAVFLVAALVYLLTMETSASFWDCSERITAAYKLEVPHPPGAPFFMLMGHFFTLFAGGNVGKVALAMNSMSALAGAFTILFLFWSITHLARKLLRKEIGELSLAQAIAVLGSGAIGALAYTFTDSFWFISVEAEAYATSSMLTAIVFWAILKWESEFHEAHANRWLVLIAFIMGLSIGVHLLNLLTIPALVLVYYFKKYTPTRWGVVAALAASVGLLGGVMYVFIPGIVSLAAAFELLFVNSFSMPYNSGLIIFVITLVAFFSWGIWFSIKKQKVLLHAAVLGLAVMSIGYSSYALLVIRAQANPPMNQNNPSTAFSLLHYLNREQYGDRPLIRGNYYNAPITDVQIKETYRRKDGKYIKTYLKPVYEHDSRFKAFFSRMWSWQDDHIEVYKEWGKIKGRPIKVQGRSGEMEVVRIPTFGENLRFFFSYQVNHMYWRYFMWNFVGRQNDVQGHGDLINGNWITGIKPLDAIRMGNQDKLTPEMLSNSSRNTYFMLPLLLGILGLIVQFKHDKNNFWIITMLFVLTGLAIVVYLNQTPMQPRERDYSYVGSFYAFSIWIGLGVLALFELARKYVKPTTAAGIAIALSLSVPLVLVAQNWDDHNRSGRTFASDFAYNYLNTCEPNAIIFTNGDNDTFPLWYAQEVEGIRPDVRIANLSLLGTDWYCEQMKWKSNESDPLPITMDFEQFVQGTRDRIYVIESISQPYELKKLMEFVASDEPSKRHKVQGNEFIDYLPTKHLKITVDKQKVLEKGVVSPKDSALIVDEMVWKLNKDDLTKSQMMVLEIIANNNWERPIYFVSSGGDSDLGLSEYLQLEGFAYKLVPIKTPATDYLSVGRINVEKLYKNYMEEFKWGGLEYGDVMVDHNLQRTALVLRLRNNFTRLAEELIERNEVDSAVAILDRVEQLLPVSKFPYDLFMLGIAQAYYNANETEKANAIVAGYAQNCVNMLEYIYSLTPKHIATLDYDISLNTHILQELLSIAKEYGQNELQDEFQYKFDEFLALYYQRGIY